MSIFWKLTSIRFWFVCQIYTECYQWLLFNKRFKIQFPPQKAMFHCENSVWCICLDQFAPLILIDTGMFTLGWDTLFLSELNCKSSWCWNKHHMQFDWCLFKHSHGILHLEMWMSENTFVYEYILIEKKIKMSFLIYVTRLFFLGKTFLLHI